jgi:hypothetical protein
MYICKVQKQKIIKRLPSITLALIAVVMLLITSNINWGKDHWNQIVRSDGEGYYAYLPAVFIYHDPNFGFFEHIEKEKYFDPFNCRDYREVYQGKMINKCYAGEAFVVAPFFLAAHFYAKMAGFDTDGYSKPYPIGVSIANWFYLLMGLFFLMKLLRFYLQNNWVISLVLITALFGTNLFFYVVGEPSMNHVYSFAFITCFLFCAKKYLVKPRPMNLPLLGLLLGIIVLIRPINILILLALPFLAGNLSLLKSGFISLFKKPLWIVLSILLFLLIVSVQLLLYYWATGSFFIYSYGKESFNFSDPHFIDFLFSYKKGYFLYTPIAFISLAGFWSLWKSRRFELFSLLIFFIIIIYIFSSWWSWWYGGSFSSRVMVDFSALFMILLGIAVESLKKKWFRSIYFSIVVLLILVCQIQTFQYRYYKIHWADMNREKYWDVFLRIDQINK